MEQKEINEIHKLVIFLLTEKRIRNKAQISRTIWSKSGHKFSKEMIANQLPIMEDEGLIKGEKQKGEFLNGPKFETMNYRLTAKGQRAFQNQ